MESKVGAGGSAQQLRALAALVKDMHNVHSSHNRQLTRL